MSSIYSEWTGILFDAATDVTSLIETIPSHFSRPFANDLAVHSMSVSSDIALRVLHSTCGVYRKDLLCDQCNYGVGRLRSLLQNMRFEEVYEATMGSIDTQLLQE